jgi:phosphoribosylformimino-5-aminoimidazole carboxamide ribotide isomerase
MKIIPAIDIKNGNVVRLVRGDYDNVKIYSNDPRDIAKMWYSKGADTLHVVDLDGALAGEPKNMDSVKEIVKSVSIPVELGGGLRNLDYIDWAFKVGVSKVVLGTKAVEDIDFVTNAIKKYGDKIIVSIDSKGGFVMLEGWTRASSINAIDMVRKLENIGASAVIYTDITVDGTLSGPNFTRLDNFLSNVNISVIAAGGVASTDDVRKLCALNRKNLVGIIVGKGLYEGTVDLKEAIKICLRKE